MNPQSLRGVPLTTPVAFLIFNRPDCTREVFRHIAAARPPRLLLVADGPRNSEEEKKCREARAIVTGGIDWDCDFLQNVSDVNLGCKGRVSSGLRWVFDQCPEAIILEDDCVPAASFFPFCQALLERYCDDDRIMVINGTNFQPRRRTPFSYFFARYSMIWGWASWRRAFQHYDLSMQAFPSRLETILSQFTDPYEKEYWRKKFTATFEGHINTWDYQWLFACWLRGGLSIAPEANLVSNIGFRGDATHTMDHSPFADWPIREMWELVHPPGVVRNSTADDYTFDRFVGGRYLKRNDSGLWQAWLETLRFGARMKKRLLRRRPS